MQGLCIVLLHWEILGVSSVVEFCSTAQGMFALVMLRM
jgi:hypothetical protein